MKRNIAFLTLTVYLMLAMGPGVHARDHDLDRNYEIGPGDVLQISVWKNEDLTRQLTAAGKSVNELEKILVEKLVAYVPEPDLSINVTQVNSMVIYVIGKVNSPGRFAMNTRIVCKGKGDQCVQKNRRQNQNLHFQLQRGV